ncbi:MAG: tetratricopeptide repeat protein [Planctomycetota bacterium]
MLSPIRRQVLTRFLPVILSLLIVACFTVSTTAQTTQPEKMDHAALVEQSAAHSLVPERFTSPDGRPLTEEDTAEIEKARQYMLAARQSRTAGDFKAAADTSGKAAEVYARLLGTGNHNTISAMTFRATASRIASASTEAQGAMVQAYRQLEAAEAAHDQGNYAEAVRSAQQALTTFELTLGDKHGSLVRVLRTLGNAQLEMQRFREAEASLSRALELGEAVYGKMHPQVAATLDRQGWMFLNTGRFEEAVEVLTRSVRISMSSVGETAELAEALDNLGTALLYARDPRKALSSKLRAYVIRDRLLGPEARDTAVSLSNIAWLYSRIGGPTSEEVIPLRKRAMAIFAKQLGPAHPYTSLEKANLAYEYVGQKQPEKALTLYEELVALDRQHPNKLDVMAVTRLITLGGLYLELDRLEDALRSFNEAYEAGEVLYKKGEAQAAIEQLHGLATTYMRRRMFDDAVRVFETIRQWSDQRGIEPQQEDVRRMLQFGIAYIEAGRVQDAQRVLNIAVQTADRLHENDSSKTIAPRLTLSLAFEKSGDWANAERLAEEALRIAEKELSPKHAARGRAFAALGRVQMKADKLDLAKFSLEEAKQIFEEKRNQQNSFVAHIKVLEDLAACHDAAGEKSEAISLLREAVDKSREIFAASEGKNLMLQATLAEALKLLIDNIDKDPAATEEATKLKGELKQILTHFRDIRALSVENKAWLNEL